MYDVPVNDSYWFIEMIFYIAKYCVLHVSIALADVHSIRVLYVLNVSGIVYCCLVVIAKIHL